MVLAARSSGGQNHGGGMPEGAKGALAGWKWQAGDHGVVVRLQLVSSPAAYDRHEFDIVQVSLNDRQLRSFARDIQRAAEARGLELWAKRPLWRRWLFRNG